MRQEFRKQLTRLRKIQDKVINSGDERISMYVMASPLSTNACVTIECFNVGNEKAHISYMIWNDPHRDECAYDEMLRCINEFYGFAD